MSFCDSSRENHTRLFPSCAANLSAMILVTSSSLVQFPLTADFSEEECAVSRLWSKRHGKKPRNVGDVDRPL